ncbi:putative signal peptide peptidase SppA [Pseudobythopirellula maris]|uniref:Putative signal peptide peptidase SppA n=1 Tax=Pseudobythopirellula maris TaxID=2527991 RepID=A0A5C5ZVI3_9BACT|nr:signal peptide peptidase SppA [Pseudobythopirellula maris]TWT91135.1 putative signal peptide peptidase SppA [Pseudobythopirellula maris]
MSEHIPLEPAGPARTPVQTIVLQPKESLFGRFGKFLLLALGLCVVSMIGMAGAMESYFSPEGAPQEKYHSLSKEADKKIAVVDVSGTIIESDTFVKQQIDRVREDESVVAVVLRINSPGGTVTYSDYLHHHLRELAEERDLPLVVSMGSLCASGGYYLAMAVGDEPDTLFAEPTTWTGSIGVIIPHYNLTGLMETWGVENDSYASAELKQMGSPTHEPSEREREVLQELVDESFEGFKEIVRGGRPELADDPEKLTAATTGQIFTAKQALELGLVDELGFIEEAVARAAELAGVSADEVRCVKYKRPVSAFDSLLGASARSRGGLGLGSEMRALLDLSTPRAYYLCTLLPALLENQGR